MALVTQIMSPLPDRRWGVRFVPQIADRAEFCFVWLLRSLCFGVLFEFRWRGSCHDLEKNRLFIVLRIDWVQLRDVKPRLKRLTRCGNSLLAWGKLNAPMIAI